MTRSAANASISRTRSASAPFSTSSRRAILSSVIVGLRFGHRSRNPNSPKLGGDHPRRPRPRAALRQGLRARPLTPRRGAQTWITVLDVMAAANLLEGAAVLGAMLAFALFFGAAFGEWPVNLALVVLGMAAMLLLTHGLAMLIAAGSV